MTKETIKFLQQNKLLAGVSEDLINEIAQNLFIETFKPGDIIIHEGEPGDIVCSVWIYISVLS